MSYTITTVKTPAESFDLTDLETVKDELDLGEADTKHDGFLQRGITQVSADMANSCNRVFAVQTYIDEIRRSDHEGQGNPLVLANAPAQAVNSVIEDGTTLVEDTDYEVDLSNGFLYRLDSSGNPRQWYGRKIVIEYDAGFAEVPADLAAAALRWITMRYHSAGRDPSVRSIEEQGIQTTNFWVGDLPSRNDLPAEIARVVAQYRIPLVG